MLVGAEAATMHVSLPPDLHVLVKGSPIEIYRVTHLERKMTRTNETKTFALIVALFEPTQSCK